MIVPSMVARRGDEFMKSDLVVWPGLGGMLGVASMGGAKPQ